MSSNNHNQHANANCEKRGYYNELIKCIAMHNVVKFDNVLKQALSDGFDINYYIDPPLLHYALWNTNCGNEDKSKEIIMKLLRAGANLELVDPHNNTPLFVCVNNPDIPFEIFQYIASHVDINAKYGSPPRTALETAIIYFIYQPTYRIELDVDIQIKRILSYLIKIGANPSIDTSWQKTLSKTELVRKNEIELFLTKCIILNDVKKLDNISLYEYEL